MRCSLPASLLASLLAALTLGAAACSPLEVEWPPGVSESTPLGAWLDRGAAHTLDLGGAPVLPGDGDGDDDDDDDDPGSDDDDDTGTGGGDDDDEGPGACTDSLSWHAGSVTVSGPSADVDLAAFCAESNAVAGDLFIAHVTDPQLLGCVCAVSGTLTLNALPGLVDLSSLPPQNELGGLSLVANPDLETLDGLQWLASLPGNLEIYENPRLEDLWGLANLEDVGGFLVVRGSYQMADLQGLAALEQVGWYVALEFNPVLLSLGGLDALHTIDGDLFIAGNVLLESLDGADALQTITDEVWVVDNPQLPTSSVRDWVDARSVGGDVVISGNGAG